MELKEREVAGGETVARWLLVDYINRRLFKSGQIIAPAGADAEA